MTVGGMPTSLNIKTVGSKVAVLQDHALCLVSLAVL